MMAQIFPAIDREGISVTHEEEVVGDLDYGFIHVVGDDYTFMDFLLLNQSLHLFHHIRSYVLKRLVKDAEFSIGLQILEMAVMMLRHAQAVVRMRFFSRKSDNHPTVNRQDRAGNV